MDPRTTLGRSAAQKIWVGGWKHNSWPIGNPIWGARASARIQERLGAAIVQLTTVQTLYDTPHAANQEQLGSATVVATLTQSPMSGMRLDQPIQDSIMVAAPRSWPALPMVSIVVASLLLMGLYSAGLLVSSRRLEVPL